MSATLYRPFRKKGGSFPHLGADINWSHPLSVNLVFFGVPAPYGYFDLVRRQPMPHQPITGSPITASCIQLFTQTPLGIPAWAYGSGSNNPRGAYARTPGSQPSYNTTSMTVAAGWWTFPYASYGGGQNRFCVATNSANIDNNGMLATYVANDVTGIIGGNAGTGTVFADLTNINNPPYITHGSLTSFDGTNLIAQRDNGLFSSSNQSARAPLANIDHIQIGDTTNTAGRPVFWAAVWSVALSSTLRNFVTTGEADGNVSRNPVFGQIPAGLLVKRYH